MGTSAKQLPNLSSRTGRSGKYFTKFSDDTHSCCNRWFPATKHRETFMFRDQIYPSASAALEAYILEYDGIPTDSTFSKSQRCSSDVDVLLSAMPGLNIRNRSSVREKYESLLAQSQMVSDISMTLEESQRVLNRINDDDLDGNPRNCDVYSCITDNTDVLLQAKPYPALQRTKHRRDVDGVSRNKNGFGSSRTGMVSASQPKSHAMRNTRSKSDVKRPESFSRSCDESRTNGTPPWVQDLAQSEMSVLSNGNLRENRRLYSSQPGVGISAGVTEQENSGLGKALSLNDLNHNDLQQSYLSRQSRTSGNSRQLLQKLTSVEKRNKILRQLLYSRNIVGQGTVLKPVGSETSGTVSTPDMFPAGRNVHFSVDAADILTSTFQNTPKKLTVDVSSIESANSTQQEESSYIQKRVRRKGKLTGLTNEAARRLVSDVPNEKHKQYLGSLIKDIEDSSSSVVTTPWLEVLQKDLGMLTGEVPRMKTAAEREALAAEVEEIIRVNTRLSATGSVEELLVPISPAGDTEVKSRHSLDTEEILNGDRSWEAPLLSLKKPVCVDKTSESARRFKGDRSRIVDQFLTECMGSDETNDPCNAVTGREQPGTMETLKNMLFSVQAMAPSEEVDEDDTAKNMENEKSQLEVQKIVQSASTDNPTAQSKDSLLKQAAVPDELKHLLSVSFDGQTGTDSLDKAMTHLKNLQTLVRPSETQKP